MRPRRFNRLSHVAWCVLALAVGCSLAAAGGEPSGLDPGRNLVSNPSMGTLDEYDLPAGYRYDFAADADGAKPKVEIAVEAGEKPGDKCLAIVGKSTQGSVYVVLPADLSGQSKSGKRYFLVRARVRTAGDAELYVAADRRLRSRSIQSHRWITISVPIESGVPVDQLSLVFAAGKPGDAVRIGSVFAAALSREEYEQCFINTTWRIVGEEEMAGVKGGAAGGGGGNMLVNSSFELGRYAGTQGKTAFGGVSTAQGYDGKCAARALRFQTIYYPFKPDTLYTVSVYARSEEEGAKLKLSVRSGCEEVLQEISYPWNRNAAEARMTFPLTSEWARYHFSFVTAPDPDPDCLAPFVPRDPKTEEVRLMVMLRGAIQRMRMEPKSAFKVIMEHEDKNGGEGARVWIDAVQLEPGPLTAYRAATANGCGVELERSDTGDLVYYEDRPIQATGLVFTEDTTPRTVGLSYRITDFFGREIKRIDRTVETKGEKRLEDHLSFLSPWRGLLVMTLSVKDPESVSRAGEVVSMQQAFGVVSPLPRSWPFDEKAQYGIHSPARRAATDSRFILGHERMKKLGIKWLRAVGRSDVTSWISVEPEKGKWVWADDVLDAPANKEFMILGSLYYAPDWLGGDGRVIDTVAGHWEEWEEYVFQVIRHYKDRIKYWEVWGEPHYHPKVYGPMLKHAFQAARRADGEAKVVGLGGLSLPSLRKHVDAPEDRLSASWKGHVEGVFDIAGMESMDLVSIDNYVLGRPEENWWPLSQRVQYIKGEMRKRGRDLDIWDTEAGLVTGVFYTDRVDGVDNCWNRAAFAVADPSMGVLSGQTGPRDAANWMAQRLAVYLANGCKKFFYHFNLCGGDDMDSNSGVLYEYDDSPKAHWAAWAASALMLDRSTFVAEIPFGKDVRCYVFEREGVPTAAYWRLKLQEPEPPAGTLTLTCAPEKIDCFDIMSSPLYGVEIRGKEISIPLTSDLAYIRGKGMSPDELVAILRKARRSDKEQKVVDEPFPQTPEAKAEPAATATPKKENPVMECRRATDIKIDGKKDDWQGLEPITIGGLEHVVAGRPVEDLPVGVQRCWQSNEDLSAKLWTAWDEDNIYWAVLVSDNMVVENRMRGKAQAYNGDCVEVFLDGRESTLQSVPEYDERVGQILVTPATAENPSATVSVLSAANIVKEMKAASSPVQGGFFVEGAIPIRRLLPEGLAKGRVVGFDIALDDTDDGGSYKTHMTWSGNAGLYRDASGFGRLRLVD
ncbi:MAG: sugar-binding protein [Planctomycetota bacterium]